jgi:hypothetical protein
LDWSLVYPELAGGEAKPKSAKKEDPKKHKVYYLKN